MVASPESIGLRPGMSLGEIAKATGAAVLEVTSAHYRDSTHISRGHSSGFGLIHQGRGTLRGKTITEPPLHWSVEAWCGLDKHELAVGAKLTAAALSTCEGINSKTFSLTE